jgi:glycosyltransferase involved in cell wall biosynthesis
LRQLRIGLVLPGLDRPLTGVTRVAVELARALDRTEGCELALLSTTPHPVALEGLRAPVYFLPGCARVPGLMMLGGPELAIAARRLGLDAIHDPVGVSPFTLGRWSGHFKRIVTIHDAIAFEYPQGYSASNNFLHRRFVPWTLRNVDAVITVSRASRASIVRTLRLPEDLVTVVSNGVGAAFRPLSESESRPIAARYGLEPGYILHVGSSQPRKNLPGLLAAFDQVLERSPDQRLVLVGSDVARSPATREAIARVRAPFRVIALGTVPDADLAGLYAAAALFVLPSLFEGFGIPLLEAMACGTPVVCADIPALVDTAGDAAIVVDARDPHRLADAMMHGLNDAVRTRLRGAGPRRAALFSWKRSAQDSLAVYQRVVTA